MQISPNFAEPSKAAPAFQSAVAASLKPRVSRPKRTDLLCGIHSSAIGTLLNDDQRLDAGVFAPGADGMATLCNTMVRPMAETPM